MHPPITIIGGFTHPLDSSGLWAVLVLVALVSLAPCAHIAVKRRVSYQLLYPLMFWWCALAAGLTGWGVASSVAFYSAEDAAYASVYTTVRLSRHAVEQCDATNESMAGVLATTVGAALADARAVVLRLPGVDGVEEDGHGIVMSAFPEDGAAAADPTVVKHLPAARDGHGLILHTEGWVHALSPRLRIKGWDCTVVVAFRAVDLLPEHTPSVLSTLFIVLAVAAGATCLFSMVAHYTTFVPLEVVRRRITKAAFTQQMQQPSVVTEVRGMQRAFDLIATMFMHYRDFLPELLLPGSDGESDPEQSWHDGSQGSSSGESDDEEAELADDADLPPSGEVAAALNKLLAVDDVEEESVTSNTERSSTSSGTKEGRPSRARSEGCATNDLLASVSTATIASALTQEQLVLTLGTNPLVPPTPRPKPRPERSESVPRAEEPGDRPSSERSMRSTAALTHGQSIREHSVSVSVSAHAPEKHRSGSGKPKETDRDKEHLKKVTPPACAAEPANGSPSTPTQRPSSASTTTRPAPTIRALNDRKVTLLVVQVCELGKIIRAHPPGWFLNHHTNIVTLALHTAKHKTGEKAWGTVDCFQGDYITIGFNTQHKTTNHRVRAVTYATQFLAAHAEVADGLTLAAGASSGKAKLGIMGCQGVRTFNVVGNVATRAAYYAQLAASWGVKVLVGDCVGREVRGIYEMRRCYQVETVTGNLVWVNEVLHELKDRKGGPMEWMYELEQRSKAPFRVLDKAIKALFNADFSDALLHIRSEVIANLPPTHPALPHAHRLGAWLTHVLQKGREPEPLRMVSGQMADPWASFFLRALDDHAEDNPPPVESTGLPPAKPDGSSLGVSSTLTLPHMQEDGSSAATPTLSFSQYQSPLAEQLQASTPPPAPLAMGGRAASGSRQAAVGSPTSFRRGGRPG